MLKRRSFPRRHTVSSNLVHNLLFLVVFLVFIIGFSMIYNGIIEDKFKDKCANTKVLMDIYALQTEQAIISIKDYYSNRAFYETKLMMFLELFNAFDDRYSAVYDSELNLLSRNIQEKIFNKDEQKEYFNPKKYTEFLNAIDTPSNNVQMVELNWETPNKKIRKMYVFYRWIPVVENIPHRDRYLIVSALSKESIINDFSLKVIQVVTAIMLGVYIVMMYYSSLSLRRKYQAQKTLNNMREKRIS